MNTSNPMNAVALFLTVGKLRPAETWTLTGWSFVWLFVIGLLQVSLQPVPDLGSADQSAMLGKYFSSLALVVPIGLLSWALPFAAWMRLLTTGRGNGVFPFRLGREEMWAIFVLGAIVLAMWATMAVVLLVGFLLVQLVPALIVLAVVAVPALGIVAIYISIRLTPAAALSAMTHRFAVVDTWRAMDGKVVSVFLAWLVIVVASVVLGLVAMTIGNLVPGLSLAQAMNDMMLGGERPALTSLAPALFVSLAVQLPVTLMSYSVAAYSALAISGRDDAWTQAIEQVEREAAEE